MLTLTLLGQTFTVHQLPPDADVPVNVLMNPFLTITRTEEELSLVLPDSVDFKSTRSNPGWACFRVEGPLEFSLVGILAGISSILAEAEIPIFALSTFDTDYILVKQEQAQAAGEALASAGYLVHQGKK
jgi:hypothetical protein